GNTHRETAPLRDHRAALEHLLQWIVDADSGVPLNGVNEIDAVGRRVTHGGERFWRSARIDDDVLRGIEDTIELAPLHNPNNLRGVLAARAALGPGLPQVAV